VQEEIPESYLVGHYDDGNPRELTTLMNDAWSMDSTLTGWELRNPGCFVHHSDFATFGLEDVSVGRGGVGRGLG
jgi:hypothetical protein